MKAEKCKNSPRAGDKNPENGCIGVNWVREFKYPIGFCISTITLDVLLNNHWNFAKFPPGRISVALKMWERDRIVEFDI